MIHTKNLNTKGILRPDMRDLDIAHLAGVFDAVGSATVHISKNERYRLGYQFQPLIRIHRPIGDEAMMGKLTAYADDENVRYHISEKSHGEGRESKSYEFVVNDPHSIERFLEPLLPHLVSRFEPVVLMLDEIIPAVKEGKHKEKEGFLELMEVADEIRSSISHGPEPKYTKDYFEEEWGEELATA